MHRINFHVYNTDKTVLSAISRHQEMTQLRAQILASLPSWEGELPAEMPEVQAAAEEVSRSITRVSRSLGAFDTCFDEARQLGPRQLPAMQPFCVVSGDSLIWSTDSEKKNQRSVQGLVKALYSSGEQARIPDELDGWWDEGVSRELLVASSAGIRYIGTFERHDVAVPDIAGDEYMLLDPKVSGKLHSPRLP